MLRIKCTGQIEVDGACLSPVTHSDMIVRGNINLCVPKERAAGVKSFA